MATFTQRQIKGAQTSRALFTLVAAIFAALTWMHFAGGADILAVTTALPATLFAVSALLATHRIGIMKRAVARDEFRERMAVVLSPAPPPAPRFACDVSTTLDRSGRYNGLITVEDASGKPGGAGPVIRAVPCGAVRDLASGRPAVTAWTVAVRSADPEEAARWLDEAEPLLPEHLARASGGSDGTRYFRLDGRRLREVTDNVRVLTRPGGRLALWSDLTQSEMPAPDWRPMRAASASMADMALGFARPTAALGSCAHPDAEPVDLLVTGERVAWLCPECGAELPADWR